MKSWTVEKKVTQRFSIKTSIVNRIKCAQEPILHLCLPMHLLSCIYYHVQGILIIFLLYINRKNQHVPQNLYVYMFICLYVWSFLLSGNYSEKTLFLPGLTKLKVFFVKTKFEGELQISASNLSHSLKIDARKDN